MRETRITVAMTRTGHRRWHGFALREGKLVAATADWRNEKGVPLRDGHLDRSAIANTVGRRVPSPIRSGLSPILDAVDPPIWSLTLMVAEGDAPAIWSWRSGTDVKLGEDGVSRMSGLVDFSAWLQTLPVQDTNADDPDD